MSQMHRNDSAGEHERNDEVRGDIRDHLESTKKVYDDQRPHLPLRSVELAECLHIVTGDPGASGIAKENRRRLVDSLDVDEPLGNEDRLNRDHLLALRDEVEAARGGGADE